MASFPRFRLYASNGTTPVYEFECVTDIDDFQDPTSFVEQTALRASGSIISEGSPSSWDLNITFVLVGTGYEDLVSKMNTLQSSIVKFTPYILKIDLTSTTTKNYNVKRINSFTFPLDNKKKRVNFQTVNAVFKVNSWS